MTISARASHISMYVHALMHKICCKRPMLLLMLEFIFNSEGCILYNWNTVIMWNVWICWHTTEDISSQQVLWKSVLVFVSCASHNFVGNIYMYINIIMLYVISIMHDTENILNEITSVSLTLSHVNQRTMHKINMQWLCQY